jgi:hypothetical protein
MDKQALTIQDITDTVGPFVKSPLVQSAALGTAGYLGSSWLYDAISDHLASRGIASIEDPYARYMAWQEHLAKKQNIKPWVTGLAGLTGLTLPLAYKAPQIYGALKSADWSKPDTLLKSLEPIWKGGMELSGDPGLAPPLTGEAGLMSYSTTGAATDLALGRDFRMPAVRPLSFFDDKDIPVRQSVDLLYTQQPIVGREPVRELASGFQQAGEGRSGLISTGDLVRGLVGAGFGAAAGWGLGNILGTIFAQPAEVKAKMAHYGAIGGAVVNSGLLNTAGRAIFA